MLSSEIRKELHQLRRLFGYLDVFFPWGVSKVERAARIKCLGDTTKHGGSVVRYVVTTQVLSQGDNLLAADVSVQLPV